MNLRMVLFTAIVLIGFTAEKALSTCVEWSCEFGAECQETDGSGECVCPKLPCPEAEKKMHVCGVDGKTYRNLCEMRQTMCETQTFIEVDHLGECGEQQCNTKWECIFGGECLAGKCICVKCRDVIDRRVYYRSKFVPALKRTSVCGTDGITYESQCHLNYHSCMSKRIIFVKSKGVCRSPQALVASSERKRSRFVQRSVVVERLVERNCSKLIFSQCVSKNHPRIRYMGEFTKIPNKFIHGSPVYQLTKEGSESSQEDYNSKASTTAFLSRFISSQLPRGAWIVGSKLGSGKGWLGSKDPALTPADIKNTWKSSNSKKKQQWTKEPSLSLQCSTLFSNYECAKSFFFDGTPKSLWQPVSPRTPYYTLDVAQTWVSRPKGKAKRKITVKIKAKRKTNRFTAYMLRLSTDRLECGFPELTKSKMKHHEEKCGGSLIVSKMNKNRMKAKIVFRAPEYGCVDFSVTILSSDQHIYEDDKLVKRICSDKK